MKRYERMTVERMWADDDYYVVIPEIQVDLPKGTKVEVIIRPIDEADEAAPGDPA